MTAKLYSYWRSSTSYKVRIGLNLAGIDYDIFPVHLVRNGGEQHLPPYQELNPMSAVPTFIDDGQAIGQSNAILEYIYDLHPQSGLLPEGPTARAYVRQIRDIVACDIHPINNLRVLQRLKAEGLDEDIRSAWYHNWIHQGFTAIERMLESSEYYKGEYVHRSVPTMADCALIPQIYNAKRFHVSLDNYPILNDINETCLKNPAFINAQPENQPDAEEK